MQILQGETVIGVGPRAAELPVSSAPLRAGRCHGESLELLGIWGCCGVSLKATSC